MLWKPSADSMEKSVMFAFSLFAREELNKQGNCSYEFTKMEMQDDPVKYHQKFFEWTVKDDRFWGLLWQFLKIKSFKNYSQVISRPKKISDEERKKQTEEEMLASLTTTHPHMGSRFFVGAKVNYAQNLLHKCLDPQYVNRVALLAIGENGIKGVTVPRVEMTYGELWNRVAKMAHYLRNELGVKKMDRVVSIMSNCSESIVALLAVTSIGAVWSSVSPDLGKKIVFARFQHIEPVVLFTTEYYTFNGKLFSTNETCKYLMHHVPTLRAVIKVKTLEYDEKFFPQFSRNTCLKEIMSNEDCVNKLTQHSRIKYVDYHSDVVNGGFLRNLSPTLCNEKDIQFEPVDVDHPVWIMYTSGSTGAPKCICQGFGVLINHIKETHLHCDVKDSDTSFVYTNCGWMMWNWCVSMLYTGCKNVLYDGSPLFPNALAMWKLIETEKITFFGTSSRYLSFMVTNKIDLVHKTKLDISHLRLITTTGSPLAPSTAVYLYKYMIPHVHLSSISGGTDLNGCFALGSPFLPVYPGELQCAGLGLDVQVWNDAGERIFGDNGELVCLNPFPSYPLFFWGEKNQKRYFESYFTTFDGIWAQGDLSEQTPRFGFYVKGRSDSTLNPGGVRIGTGDYYDVLQHVKEVVDSIVVGQRQKDGNEQVVLFVQLAPNLELNEQLVDKIHDTIKTHLSSRHRPSVIAQVNGVPVNVNGKKMEKFVKKLTNQDPVQPSEISSLKNPECVSAFLPVNWKTGSRVSKL
ncbi:predicted protein [Naegleria gruberi]|uniref:Predicted protein n=1 Tax=Naegleria gruberi TaxID=5762 RepID=D2VS37_NAEGR|nr:uncharacterized protein NAEGRDRAFT_71800 [Naegleria gruberi]EFC40354.1 predicted protein [Naegleria gruberi]|eukprot:XP_002673098.1 predicted protein [Naegleria gruberi strain NEG-M]